MSRLTFDVLANAVARDGAAIRCRTRLQPLGGPGDKVFPPTYGETKGDTAYAEETRRIDGKEVPVFLLDSVASQANRLEQALRVGWEYDELKFPVISVDFSAVDGLEDLDQITVLDAPHRIADALLRDSLIDGRPFRASPAGEALTNSRPDHAAPLYHYCPTALVFGVWDSTGPKGGLGSKFPRALVSEVVAVNAVSGVKSASRRDPAGIEKAVKIYQRGDDPKEWTLDEATAAQEKGKAVLYKSKAGDDGRPSSLNHGNVMPSVDAKAGGITMDFAEQITVLSLAALRALRFPKDVSGETIDRSRRREVEDKARTALAALGVAAIVYGRAHDYFLRSRCDLVPESKDFELELVARDGGGAKSYTLDTAGAQELLTAAHDAAKAVGMGWYEGDIELSPAPKLADLIRRSRELAGDGEAS